MFIAVFVLQNCIFCNCLLYVVVYFLFKQDLYSGSPLCFVRQVYINLCLVLIFSSNILVFTVVFVFQGSIFRNYVLSPFFKLGNNSVFTFVLSGSPTLNYLCCYSVKKHFNSVFFYIVYVSQAYINLFMLLILF